MAEIDISAGQKGGDRAAFEGLLDNFSTDVERAGKQLLQFLRNPKIRAICVRGYEGLGRWRMVEYAARKLKGSDLFDVQIIVKLPKEDWSPRNVQRKIANQLGIKEGDDEDDDLKKDVQMEVLFEIYESLKGQRFLLILGDATQRIYLDDVGVPNFRNTKVVYVSCERLESEETIEFQDFSIDVLREEAVAVTSSPTIAACFTPHAVLDCFFYILLFSVDFPSAFKMGLPTRYLIAEGIMVMREGIEEEEDLTTLEKKVDALLIELKARSMVEQVDADVRVPKGLAEKAKDMVMSSNRRASTHGKFWIHKSSLPTENIGDWEDIQRMAIWNLRLSDHLPLTLKFPKLSTLLLEGPAAHTTLPNNFVFEQMQGLRVLILSYLDIKFLPLSISSLHNFRFLSIYYCRLLEPESLLSSLKSLDKLEFLQFEDTRLESIPDECLQHKNNLRSLHLTNTETRSLPSSFPKLHNLQQLSVTRCSSLIEIPDAFFERLPQLRVLNLARDDNLKSLPSSLSKLVNLRQLILTQCYSLRIELLPHLQKLSAALEVLDLNSCNSIEDIEEVSSSLGAVLPNLQKLDLSRIEVIKQVILKGCRSLESLRLYNLTGLDVLDLSGTQLQQLPEGISTASHLRRLDMLHMNHIRKINWDDLPTELEEINFDDRGTFSSPKDDENPSDEGGARMRISNYKLLQSLKPSSEVLRAKCFSRFHIRISPYQEEEEDGRRRQGIHLRGRKLIYKDINLKTQKCNLPLHLGHFERHLEIQGGKRCTNAIQGVLSRTKLLTLCDNAFIRDLGDVEMHELRECLVKSCEKMEIFFGGKNQCFECLEKIWMSDLASMRRVCDGLGRIISFPLLKHIYLEYCPRLINFVSSGVSLLSLEKLEIRFCSRLESLFQGDVVVDGSLQRLHTVHLWELPKLERICSSRYLPVLEKLTVRGCGKLKELPLRAGANNAIRGGGGVQVGGEMAWWENLRWEDESIKHDIHFIEWRPLTRR